MALPVLNTPLPEQNRLTKAFDKFHAANPQVWQEFESAALTMARTGRKRYGAKTIWEVMRYRRDLQTTGTKYKLNNNYTAYYARLFKQEYPEFSEFFELRIAKGER
jgi:hypothetical protein